MAAEFVVTVSPAARTTFEPATSPAVSFVIVTYGTAASLIDECLARLASSLHHGSVAADVVVVDNPHPAHGRSVGDRLAITTSGLRLVRPETNLGFGGGNELGLLHTRAAVVCLLNPDLLVHDGWLEPLLDVIEQRPHAIVAPRFVDRTGAPIDAGHVVLADGLTAAVGLDEAAHYASAACWVMRRDWYARTGGFDPLFHPAYFEDVDLTLRSHRLGGESVIVPVDVVHDQGTSTPDGPADISAQHETFVDLWRDELPQLAASRSIASAWPSSATDATTSIAAS